MCEVGGGEHEKRWMGWGEGGRQGITMKWAESTRTEGRGVPGTRSRSCTEYKAVTPAAPLQSATARVSLSRAAACSYRRSASESSFRRRMARSSGVVQLLDPLNDPAAFQILHLKNHSILDTFTQFLTRTMSIGKEMSRYWLACTELSAWWQHGTVGNMTLDCIKWLRTLLPSNVFAQSRNHGVAFPTPHKLSQSLTCLWWAVAQIICVWLCD